MVLVTMLAVAACGEDVAAPGDPDPGPGTPPPSEEPSPPPSEEPSPPPPEVTLASLTLSPTEPSLTDLGLETAVEVDATGSDGEPFTLSSAPTIEVLEETRAVPELSVATVNGSSTQISVTSVGPGSLRLRVTVDSVVSNTIVLSVSTPRAIVREVTAVTPVVPGDEITLVGFQMDHVSKGAVTLDGIAVTPSAVDPESLRFPAPARSAAGCTGTGVAPIGVSDAVTLTELGVRYRRDAETSVAVGDVLRLGEVLDGCLRLAPAGDALYALTIFDLRPLEEASTGPETDGWSFGFVYDVHVGEDGARSGANATRSALFAAGSEDPGPHGGLGASSTGAAPLLATIPNATSSVGSAAEFATERTTPWGVGDRFTVQVGIEQLEGTVLDVFGGYFVIGVLDRDADLDVEGRLRELDNVMQQMLTYGLPVYEALLSPNRPVTSEGSGQLLLVMADLGFGGGTTLGGTGGDSPFSTATPYILLDFGVQFFPNEIFVQLGTVAHEVAHAWQSRHMDDLCHDDGLCGGFGPTWPWGLEGGAEFVSEEVGRAAAGNSLETQLPWIFYLGGGIGPIFGTVPNMVFFQRGYFGATWFFRQLLVEAVRAGASPGVAAAEIARGALEGWYGFMNGTSTVRPGLVERYGSLIGEDWDPADALFDALARLVSDDRAGPGGLSFPAVADAWSEFFPVADLTTGEGLGIEFSARGGSFGYILITDSDRGGSYSYGASEPGIEWALARIR